MFQSHQHIKPALLATALLCNAAVTKADVLIHDLVLSDKNELATALGTEELNPITIQLTAMGNDLLLQLEPSRFNRLVEKHATAEDSAPRLYQGSIAGDPNSWARVSLHHGTISGYIYHFGTLLQLESRAYADAMFKNNASDSDFVLIEPASSVAAQPLLDMLFGATDKLSFAPTYKLSDEPAFNPRANNTGSKIAGAATTTRNATGAEVKRAIRIGIVVDSRFDEAHMNRGLARALGIINSVDAIYQSQLGIALIVEAIRVYDDPATDPMRNNGNTVDEILTNFRSVRMADERLSSDLSLVHLFSGHRDPQRVIGLGWISTACRLDGYDMSMSTPFPFDTLLAAHEIAHNLGALHDDDPQCLAETNEQPNTLMWPAISGTSTPTFSNCSARDMQASINASCNLDNIDVSVQLRTYPSSETLRRSVIVEVENNDVFGRATELVSKTEFPAGTQFSDVSAGCSIAGSTVDCVHGKLQAQSSHRTSVTATLASSAMENVVAEVDLLNASDIKTNDNRAAIELLKFENTTGEAVPVNSLLNDADDRATTPNDTLVGLGSVSTTLLLLLQMVLLRFVATLRLNAKRAD